MHEAAYARLLGMVTALQAAATAMAKLLPDEKRDLFATAMEEMVLQCEQSAKADSDYIGGLREVAQTLSKGARRTVL